jgi:hypothetical protein
MVCGVYGHNHAEGALMRERESAMDAGMSPSSPGERLQIIVTPDFLRDVDEWRSKQPDIPNRSEAIRRMVANEAQRAADESGNKP